MSTVGEANVIVRPIIADFRREVAQGVTRSLGTAPVPLPVQPTITPQAKRQFAGEVGGLRGLLLGTGQGVGARALGISAAAGGLFAFGLGALSAVKSAAALEQQLNIFEATSGATADQMARVADEANRLGSDLQLPAVSAGDAAATMTELAKAGLSVDEVLAGTRGTLQLATAANLDFATSAELAANALNAFQLPGTDAITIANLLASASDAAQGEIADFGLGLSQAGAVAHQAGLSVRETVAFLTEFAKAGIQGSDAGTSLRVALLRLIAPTQEAKDIFRTLGVNLEAFQSGAIRAPEFFEELQRKLAPLRTETRNAALATIFGTDAIRVAAIAVNDAGAKYDALNAKLGATDSAQKKSAARAKGLSGAVEGLGSNVETLGTTLGGFVKGPLTRIAKGLSTVVSDFNRAATAAGDFADAIRDADLGPLEFSITDFLPTDVSGIDVITAGLDRVTGSGKDAKEAIEEFRRAIAPGGNPLDILTQQAQFPRTGEDVKAAAIAGGRVGSTFVEAVADTIDEEEQSVINAARRVVQDAQRTLREIVEEGRRSVEASAIQAKQNLTSIGQGLAAQVSDLLDTGPLAQRIEALQDRLDKSREGLQRTSLRRALRDAKDELARAEAQVFAPTTEEERAGAKQFLTPFREKVKDAQAALEEFNSQGNLDRLRQRLDAQKARFQKILDDLIARFNAGLISGTAVNARVAALLQKNVGPMALAGKAQGFAFRQAFAAQLEALQAQIAAITGGPQTTKTGAEPAIVSPADAAKQAAGNVAAAQRSVRDAIVNLQKAQKDAITGPDGTNELLKDLPTEIARELRKAGVKPSRDVKTPPKPNVRTGGRP